MSGAISRSDPPNATLAAIRAVGTIGLTCARRGERSIAANLREGGGYRVKFPASTGACEAVIVNTGGGMTGGDRLSIDIAVESDAAAIITTPAAEKIYRAVDEPARIETRISVASNGSCAWMPQETILFDSASLTRSMEVDVAGDARFLLAECLVLGRQAMGETLRAGHFRDQWRIRRDNRLIFADNVALGGDIGTHLAAPATGNGARAIATCLLVAPDAPSRLEDARACLENAGCEAAVSAWNGMLVARFIGPDSHRLRDAWMAFIAFANQTPLPRLW